MLAAFFVCAKVALVCVERSFSVVCEEKNQKWCPEGCRITKSNVLSMLFFSIPSVSDNHPTLLDQLLGSWLVLFSLLIDLRTLIFFLSLVDRMSINRLVTNFFERIQQRFSLNTDSCGCVRRQLVSVWEFQNSTFLLLYGSGIPLSCEIMVRLQWFVLLRQFLLINFQIELCVHHYSKTS